MKKLSVILIFAGLMIFCFEGVEARDYVELVGGLTRNNFAFDISRNGETILDGSDVINDLKSGPGIYLGGRYWVNEKSGLELGLDMASSINEVNEYSSDTVFLGGGYGSYVYKAQDNLNLKIGAARYIYEYMPYSYDNQLGDGFGLLFDGEIYSRHSFVTLKGNLGYRFSEIDVTQVEGEDGYVDIEEDISINMSGLRLGAGISVVF